MAEMLGWAYLIVGYAYFMFTAAYLLKFLPLTFRVVWVSALCGLLWPFMVVIGVTSWWLRNHNPE